MSKKQKHLALLEAAKLAFGNCNVGPSATASELETWHALNEALALNLTAEECVDLGVMDTPELLSLSGAPASRLSIGAEMSATYERNLAAEARDAAAETAETMDILRSYFPAAMRNL